MGGSAVKPSPIEARALSRLRALPRMTDVMHAQHTKGHAGYGHAIDDCGYSRARLIEEAAQETADLITYLEAATCPADVIRDAQRIASWLELEMSKS